MPAEFRRLRKYASLWLTLKVSDTLNHAVIFAFQFIQYDTSPVTTSKLCLSQVRYYTSFGTTHIYTITNNKIIYFFSTIGTYANAQILRLCTSFWKRFIVMKLSALKFRKISSD